jgi:hypothetical protein
VRIDTIDHTGIVHLFPLLDGRYRIGAAAIDSKGLCDPDPAVDTFTIENASTHTFEQSDDWEMVSVPSKSRSADSLKAGGSLVHWDESGSEREVYSYYTPSAEIATIEPSKAYWRKSPGGAVVTISDKQRVEPGGEISLVNTKYGWNQIANPYIYPVRWNGGTLWRWNGESRDFEETQSVLVPWEGYWVMAESTQTVAIDSTPLFVQGTLAKRAKVFFKEQTEWQVQLTLSNGRNRDFDNLLGFSHEARDGFDRLDRYEPPRMSSDQYIFFFHDDWNRPVHEFASDIRRRWKGDNVFQVGISPSAHAEASCTLRVLGTDYLSSVYLFMADKDGITPLESNNGYEIPANSTTQYRTIFVTDNKHFIKSFPVAFSMGNPYPNPMRPVTRINYTLPYRWEEDGKLIKEKYVVRMVIYDMMGRVVRELVHRKQDPGKYTVMWDGKSNTRRLVASGTYICSLKAGKFGGIRRMVMLK